MAINEVKLWFDLSGEGDYTDFTRLSDTTRMLGDGKDSVDIVRGRPGRSSGRIPPTFVQLEYLDDDAWLDDQNGESPYYRQLVEFTPMIITVNGFTRAYVELASITVKELTAGHAKLVIEGAGIKRRLGHSVWQKPLRSPAYRALSASANDGNRLFYAPLEESAGASQLEVFNNEGSATFSGSITFGGYTAAPSSERMATLGSAGQLVFQVPEYSSTMHKVCILWTLPSTPLPAGTTLVRMYCVGGNIDYIDLEYGVSVDGTLRFISAKNGATVDDANFVAWGGHISNNHFFISMEFEQNGANLETGVLIVNEDIESFNSDPLASTTIGRIDTIIIAPEDCSGASVGQLIVGNHTAAFTNFISSVGVSGVSVLGTRGYRDEPSDDRISRLCSEEGVTVQIITSSQLGGGDGTQLGPQPAKPFLELLELCAETDGGMLYEVIDAPWLAYMTRRAMMNQAPVASPAYADTIPPTLPTKDDQARQNDVTVSNTNGSKRRYIIPDGDYLHYSTEAPPLGMSTVPGGGDLNLTSDPEAGLQAAWRAHQGAWRGKRWPAITYQMMRSVIVDDPALITALASIDPGRTILQGTLGASKWLPPGDMIGLVQGYRELVAQGSRQLQVSISSGEAWEGKVPDSNASILANDIADDAFELYIDPGLLGPEWATDSTFYIEIDGDVMKVNIVFDEVPAFINAGAIANGNNAAVTPALPAGITVNTGQSLFIWATIRNSGTGTPDDEAGWTTLVSFGNTKLYHRYYTTGVTAPQITFTGGVANADTQARMFAFSGVSRSFCSGTKLVPAASTLLNSSAQNVAYPAFTLARSGTGLIFAWKQDDATGYAPPSTYTEMADNSTTTGDDSSIAAYYLLDAIALTAGSITVTGGASAISRAISLALRPMQSFDVTRNIQGNAVAHSAGAAIHVWRQGVTGL